MLGWLIYREVSPCRPYSNTSNCGTWFRSCIFLKLRTHVWRFSTTGSFTTKSAYEAFFAGSITFVPWRRLWNSWAPAKCKTFLWLAIRNRCWTADRLRKRGLQHPARCVLCDQEEEDVQHILTTCVFAREFWFTILNAIGLAARTPDQSANTFADWWRKACKRLPKTMKKGLNSLIILGSWLLWKLRNSIVFDSARPCLNTLLVATRDEF
jgi:hypothetical protein